MPVETYETLDALIAFDIDEAGEHSIELKYMPEIYKLSFAISGAGIALFLLLCIIDVFFKPLFRKLLKLEDPVTDDILWTLDDFDRDAEEAAALPPIENKSLKEQISLITSKLKSKNLSSEEKQESGDAENDAVEETTDKNDNGGN